MERGTSTPRQGRPLIFGEVLFDCFPDGPAVMGGAPFNVAWHLQGFGAHPLFISRIGQDPRGQDVLDAMQAWGMDVAGIQRDAEWPTGTVRIEMQGKSHSFDILADQAYDRIATEPALTAAAGIQPTLLYYGSLITRSTLARDTLSALRAATAAPAFVDINLRAPWWTAAAVEALMRTACWLKLNDDELSALRGETADFAAALQQAQALRRELELELVVLTRGVQGASYVGESTCSAEPPPVIELADTVGAGDAFSAVTILGLLRGWDLQLTLARALEFAARICSQRGATAADPGLYAGFREAWSL